MRAASHNLRLVFFESVITAGLLCMPIMTPFFLSINLNQQQIALSQMVFTVTVMVLNIPAGWISDRFSRKWANVVGDLGCFITLLMYSQVHSFAGIVICESMFGLFLAFSQGVDASLLKHFSGQIDGSGRLYKTTNARVASWQYVGNLILMMLGGPIGAIDFRLAIGLSSVTYLAGGIAAVFVKDDSENLVPTHKNPLKDMLRVIKDAVKDPALRLRLFAYAVARETTHGIVWVFTPLMLVAGVPLAIVSVGWAINSVAGFVGAKVAVRFVHQMREWQIFAVPIMLVAISLGVLSIHFSLATLWLYLLMGVTQGWTSATMLPLVQAHAKPSEQTSVISLARVIAQLLYIPSVWIIGIAADIKTEYSMLATLLIFVPLGVAIIVKLRREE